MQTVRLATPVTNESRLRLTGSFASTRVSLLDAGPDVKTKSGLVLQQWRRVD